MNLEELRQQIDDVDERIVGLIAERVKIAEEIGRGKKTRNKLVEDKERENRVLVHVRRIAAEKDLSQEDIEDIYRRVIAACKHIQGIEAAFQGEVGAYSEEAVIQFFGSSLHSLPCETLEEVFQAVEESRVQFGVVPVENSLEGIISRVYDLLFDSSLKVCGETEVRVIHCLIASPGAGLDSIKKVYSHPQALAQCRTFLKHLGCELIPTYDTAGSVKMIKEKGLADAAAIASARAAEIYGMKVLAQEIEDNPNNFTRFFVLAKEDAPPSGDDKTSIILSTKNEPGALYFFLGEFARRNINLTKLESRPTRLKPWQYNFFLDFDGHRTDKAAREALESLDRTSSFVKVLGSYPRAKKAVR